MLAAFACLFLDLFPLQTHGSSLQYCLYQLATTSKHVERCENIYLLLYAMVQWILDAYMHLVRIWADVAKSCLACERAMIWYVITAFYRPDTDEALSKENRTLGLCRRK